MTCEFLVSFQQRNYRTNRTSFGRGDYEYDNWDDYDDPSVNERDDGYGNGGLHGSSSSSSSSTSYGQYERNVSDNYDDVNARNPLDDQYNRVASTGHVSSSSGGQYGSEISRDRYYGSSASSPFASQRNPQSSYQIFDAPGSALGPKQGGERCIPKCFAEKGNRVSCFTLNYFFPKLKFIN